MIADFERDLLRGVGLPAIEGFLADVAGEGSDGGLPFLLELAGGLGGGGLRGEGLLGLLDTEAEAFAAVCGGGGVGLACRRGGAEGRGTVVTMYLPLAPAPAAPADTRRRGPAGGEKVLVVDDEAAVRQMVGATLQTAGYRVETAGSAAEALDRYTAAAHEPFHLVLSDVVMPQGNGFDLARRLLAHDANVNVLFMSGHVSVELARAHGVYWNFEMLFKPFRSETLLRAVRTALERGGAKAPAGSGGC